MFRAALVLFCSILVTACASYQNKVYPVKQNILLGKCELALNTLDEMSSKDSDDRLLYLMEYGSALQICRDYTKSNLILQTADNLSEQIDFHSISRVLGATLLNEEMIQYKGDKFEKFFINALAALNYLELGRLDDATVEVRRINEKYLRYSAEEKKSFELNSFSKYLSGLIWEAGNRYDDACIDYQEAYRLDKRFRNVGRDMLTACWRAHRNQEFFNLARDMASTYSDTEFAKRKVKKEVVIVFLQGWGPKKAPRKNDAVFPYLLPTPSTTKKLGVSTADQSLRTEIVYDVASAAIATLEADYSSLTARRLGARVAKEVMADQIRQKDKTLGDVAWLIMVASEHADLRNWTFLPETIQVVRMDPGSAQTLKLIGYDDNGNATENFEDIDLRKTPGKKIYLVRSIK